MSGVKIMIASQYRLTTTIETTMWFWNPNSGCTRGFQEFHELLHNSTSILILISNSFQNIATRL